MTTVSSDRIRIKLKAYDYRILDKAVAEIVDTARNTGTPWASSACLLAWMWKSSFSEECHG